MNRRTNKLIKKLRGKKFDDRIRAAEELGKTGDPEAINPLIETLKEILEDANAHQNSELLGISAAKSLTQLGVDHTNTLIEFLNSRNPVTAARAAVALGELKRRDILEHLFAKVSCRDPLVRSQVVWALGETGMGDKRVEDTLRDLACSDPDGYVKGRAQEALEKLGVGGELLKVIVVPATGGQPHTLEVNSKTTVKLLKKQVGKIMHVKYNKIVLSFENRMLQDDLTLLEEGVKDKSELYMICLPKHKKLIMI
ncbi:MAG: HEAT repeat domain-containing protein [Candidatus Freyarchaeota archaeon]|nr:HEAT repeat domain-containing protein [Candidatus Jordarchaeia archaeon]MBS7269328.1 HEAT repeat domain-containing protein [Candidatus Jordarchaeia archaeon]MBS7281134.1 HEAT repeat domain-containing protein [Candidatus Jordarchaeia archaeon]